jgi:hypothetical protein
VKTEKEKKNLSEQLKARTRIRVTFFFSSKMLDPETHFVKLICDPRENYMVPGTSNVAGIYGDGNIILTVHLPLPRPP